MKRADMTFDETSPESLLAIAIGLATQAGPLAVAMRHGAASNPDTKSSPVDLVTAADKAVEAQLVSGILSARPNDSIFGEEGADNIGTTNVRWILDPIDGTTNYVYDRLDYSISIAVEVAGEVVAGVVHRPATNTMYAAAKGRGATANGTPITCSTPDNLSVSLIGTGFGYNPDRRKAQAEVLVTLLPLVRDIRRGGSAALDLCAVACGQSDAYYERGLNYWDFAAGWLIATEAGAVVTGLTTDQPDETFLIAASPTIRAPLLALLQGVVVDE